MNQFCLNCGAQVNPGAGFCPACGAGMEAAMKPDPGAAVREREPAMGAGAAPVSPGVFSTYLGSLKQFLKDPKQLISVIALGLFWLILSLLPALGCNSLPVRILSFLTFAQGGMYAGAWGALGGIMGKAVFAYFFSLLIAPLFSGKNPFKGMEMGFKGLMAGLVIHSAGAAGQLMLGLGLALVLFNFFTGNAGFVNSAAGIAAFLLALKALWSRGGLLRTLIIAAARKLSGGRTPSESTINRVISGFAAGSALGVVLAALPLPYLPYLLGAVVLIAGIIISIASKPRGEAAAV